MYLKLYTLMSCSSVPGMSAAKVLMVGTVSTTEKEIRQNICIFLTDRLSLVN